MDNPVVAQLNRSSKLAHTFRETGVKRQDTFAAIDRDDDGCILPMSSLGHYGCVQACDVYRHVGGECYLLYRAPTVAFHLAASGHSKGADRRLLVACRSRLGRSRER